MPQEQNVLYGPVDNTPLPSVPLGEYLLRRLQKLGDKVAQVYPTSNETYTYADILSRGLSIAQELQTRGVKSGDVIVIICKQSSEFAPVLLGSLFVGAILAPLNPTFDTHDLTSLLTTLQPRILFYNQTAAPTVTKTLPNLVHVPEAVLLDQGPIWRSWISHESRADFHAQDIPDFEDQEAIIMTSSGTSGLPKGVMLTHKGIYAQLHSFSIEEGMYYPGDILLQVLPSFWISGLFMQLMSIYLPIKLIVLPEFEPEMFFKTVQEHKVTVTFMSPNVSVEAVKHASLKKYDHSSLRYINVGGAAMSGELQTMVQRQMNLRICQLYGMTEILIVVGSNPKSKDKVGSSGRLQPNVIAKVVDVNTCQTLGPGQEGELCFKTPCLTKGYYKNPEATAAAIDSEGWMHTGDIGFYDDQGLFYIVDRIKDLIKYKGHHVAPMEIEAVLLEHPGVREAAVVGVKHDLDQERPLAYVSRQPGATVSEQDLLQLVKDQLAEHKWLRAGVRFVDDLPKTATGKTQRALLRKQSNEPRSPIKYALAGV